MPYELYDNVKSFTPSDWERVIAVFSNAKDWQFKGWKEWKEDPTEIFSRVCGFYLKYEEEPLPEKIKNWNVKVLNVSFSFFCFFNFALIHLNHSLRFPRPVDTWTRLQT